LAGVEAGEATAAGSDALVKMLTQQKLADVAAASLAITQAVTHIERLIADEDPDFRDRPRRKGLVKIARTLETQRGILERLWS
jgi:hypothetical protein